MKQMNIWQRLNTALAVLVSLLLAGGGLALWIDKAVTASERRGEELANRVDRIHLHELLMHDALRGFLFEGGSLGTFVREIGAELSGQL